MTPFRLLIVSEPGKDGVFSIVASIVRQIHAHHPEIHVDLAYSSRRSGHELQALLDEVKMHSGESIDLKVASAPEPGDIRALAQILHFCRTREYQLIHAHSSKAGALVRLAKLLGHLPPVIYSPHAYFGMAHKGGPREAFYNFIEILLGRMGFTVVCSDDERDFALQTLAIPPSSLELIHNGIDDSHFTPPEPTTKILSRGKFDLPPEGKLLLTVGRNSSQKNYLPLYRVLDRILPAANWSFAHAGEGSVALRKTLQPEAAARCFCFDHLNDVLPLFHSADGFIMTSRYEGFSMAVLSALACGLPCLLTWAPGFQFLTKYGFNEILWLSDPANQQDLETSIFRAVEIWASQPPAILLTQRELIHQNFSERTQIEKLVKLYKTQAVKWTSEA